MEKTGLQKHLEFYGLKTQSFWDYTPGRVDCLAVEVYFKGRGHTMGNVLTCVADSGVSPRDVDTADFFPFEDKEGPPGCAGILYFPGVDYVE